MLFTDEYEYPGGWFGESWGAPVCESAQHLPTPIGEACMFCDRSIADGDQGMTVPHYSVSGYGLGSMHLSCFLRHLGIADLPDRAES